MFESVLDCMFNVFGMGWKWCFLAYLWWFCIVHIRNLEMAITQVVFVLWTPFQACLASADTQRVQICAHLRVWCVWNGSKVMILGLLVRILQCHHQISWNGHNSGGTCPLDTVPNLFNISKYWTFWIWVSYNWNGSKMMLLDLLMWILPCPYQTSWNGGNTGGFCPWTCNIHFGCTRSFLMSGMSLTRLTKTISCFTLPIMDWRDTTSISTQSSLTAILILLLLSMHYAKKLIELSSRWMMFMKEERFLPNTMSLFFPKFLQLSILMTKSQKQRTKLQKRESRQRRVLGSCDVMVWFG